MVSAHSLASTLNPERIPSFIEETLSLATEMESMLKVTSDPGVQSLKAAELFIKYGCV